MAVPLMAGAALVGVVGGLFGKKKKSVDLTPLYNQIGALNSQVRSLGTQNEQLRKELTENATRLTQLTEDLRSREERITQLAESNAELRSSMEQVEADLAASMSKLRLLTHDYDELRDWVTANPPRLRRTRKTILVAPRGSGKTTFLKLSGYNAEPSPSLRDGTICRETFLEYGPYLDTVGVPYSYTAFVRLFAIFLRDGFPDSMVIMGQRPLHLISLLQVFLIGDVYYCNLSASSLMIMYTESGYEGSLADFVETLPSYVQRSIYPLSDGQERDLRDFPSIHLLKHSTPLVPGSVSSFDGMYELLSDVSMPVLAVDATAHDLVRIDVLKEYKRLSTYTGTLTEFLNIC